MIKPRTLKGFRDFLPKEAKKRQYVIDALKEVFELYGFEPLETPALEYEEILLGKYGEEGDKLMYRFTDRGGRKVALRYDQTVPLARVIAQYGSTSSPQVLPMPFKRYQIQPVWRAENPQKGRFREFLQCDADIVGTSSPLSDAEVIALAAKSLEKLGVKKSKILVNDRELFSDFLQALRDGEKDLPTVIRALDKLKKIGKEGVLDELVKKGFSTERATYILQSVKNKKPTENLEKIFSALEKLGVENSQYEFSPTLARGLNYYTGMIFEVEIDGYSGGSVAGGGRYDRLIGMFTGRDIPAVGFSFGFDRLIEAMEELKLFPEEVPQAQVLVTIFSPELKKKSLEVVSSLRNTGVNAEVYLEESTSLEKQLKYANQKSIPYVVIIGPDEIAKKVVILRNMKTHQQKTVPQEKLPNELK